MAEDAENSGPMSFEEFCKGPGLLIGKLEEELRSEHGNGERMARAVQALSDAEGFSALVSICAELQFLRKQVDVLPRMLDALGQERLDTYVRILAITMKAMRHLYPKIDPNAVLKRTDGPEEPPKPGNGTDD